MKQSQFIIEQEGSTSGTVLLYSTFSTSMVELENTLYVDIFENHNYINYPDEVAALYEMGFFN